MTQFLQDGDGVIRVGLFGEEQVVIRGARLPDLNLMAFRMPRSSDLFDQEISRLQTSGSV